MSPLTLPNQAATLAPTHLGKIHEPVTGKILDAAVARAREIQRDLDAGRLTVPYPATVLAELHECTRVFSTWATTPERLKELAGRPTRWNCRGSRALLLGLSRGGPGRAAPRRGVRLLRRARVPDV